MSPRIHDALAALPVRQLNLIAIGVVSIAVVLAWSVALRGPLAAYRQQSQALAALDGRVRDAASVSAPADATALVAPSRPLPAPAPLTLIAAVSRSAVQAGVTVSSAAQGGQQQVGGLRLHTLDISASGSYGAILAWLAEIETGQPAVGIVQLALTPDDSADKCRIALQLAIYDTEGMQ